MRGWKMVLAAIAAAVIAMPAVAQGPRGGGFGGPGALLGNPGVQKEIKLNEEQIKKLDEFNKSNEAKRTEAREARMGGDNEKANEIGKELAAATEKFMKDTLTADQVKRVKQIGRQVAGPNAFNNEETAKELKLTDEQKDGIKKVGEDLTAQQKDVFTGVDPTDPESRTAAMKKFQGLRKEAMDKITKMLTADQKKVWKELTGEPFEVQFGPGRGFGKGKGKGKAE